MCVCVRACVRACMHACVRACVRAGAMCVCVRVCVRVQCVWHVFVHLCVLYVCVCIPQLRPAGVETKNHVIDNCDCYYYEFESEADLVRLLESVDIGLLLFALL